MSLLRMPHRRLTVPLLALALGGCATLDADEAAASAQDHAHRQFGPEAGLRLLRDDAGRHEARDRARDLLRAGPLQADAAVRVALLQSPALQARLAVGWRAQIDAKRSGWPANPRLVFERVHGGGELEITRMLALPLLDWVLWPARRDAAESAREAERLRSAQEILAAGFGVRAQWARAVAAAQRVDYHAQVLDSAEASAELARRMAQAGNFSKLQRAREQVYEVEARMRLAQARQEAMAEREALVRALGLDSELAALLRLPARLPELPAPASDADALRRDAQATRLDLAVARAELNRAAGGARAQRLAPFDAELALIAGSATGAASSRGAELELRLPWPDTGSAARASMSAAELNARARLDQVQREADSTLRERLASAQATHALAAQARDELVPLARTVAEENLLRYNGMLIGVFELLADARAQVGAVLVAIDAQRDHWLADNALKAALAGVPAEQPPAGPAPATTAAKAEAH